jgi:MYXO-CTERM domain-containing protein
MWPLVVQQTATETATVVGGTGASSPEFTAIFATGFLVVGALLVLARLRRR